MKDLYILLLAVVISPALQSQSLVIYDTTGKVIADSTITINGTSNEAEIIYKAWVENTSGAAIDVKVRKEEISLVQDSKAAICWGMCFDPAVFESPSPVSISAKSTNKTDFSGHFYPFNKTGNSTIEFIFFDSSNPDDSAKITLVFDIGTAGINTPEPGGKIYTRIYPNPVQGNLYITNAEGANIRVYNITGKTVLGIENAASPEIIDISYLTPGIYIVKVLTKNHTITRKIELQK